MSSVTADPHRHDRVRLPKDYTDPAGRPVDHGLLARLLSAVLDRCDVCAELLLMLLAEDALTTARLVELCCISARGNGDDLAVQLADLDANGAGSAPFLILAATGLVGGSAPMSRRCAQMTPEQRRAVATSAMAVMIGQLRQG